MLTVFIEPGRTPPIPARDIEQSAFRRGQRLFVARDVSIKTVRRNPRTRAIKDVEIAEQRG